MSTRSSSTYRTASRLSSARSHVTIDAVRPLVPAVDTAPRAGTKPLASGEHSSEVALISKSAGHGNLDKLETRFLHELLGLLDAPLREPLVRRHSHGLLKRAGEIAPR